MSGKDSKFSKIFRRIVREKIFYNTRNGLIS